MKIQTRDGQVLVNSLFKPIIIGYVTGMGLFLVPMLGIVSLIFLFAPSAEATWATRIADAFLFPLFIFL